MKKVLIYTTILIAAFLIAACEQLMEMPEVTNQFFTLIKDKKFGDAYKLTSSEFQKATSLEQLKSYLESNDLINFKKGKWTNVKFENNDGEMEGTVETTNGKSIPLFITFFKEDKSWKIHNIRRTDAQAGIQSGSSDIPSDEQLKSMIKTTVADLGKAINSQNFDTFYASISAIWQSQTNAAELQDVFVEFIEKKIDVETPAKSIEPVISEPPAIEPENKVLNLKGYFPASPMNVNYDLGYIYEHPNWKLIRISVNVK